MGSVIDYIECPNCQHEAYSDFYYKTGEEYVNCQNCGYHYSVTIIDREKPLSEDNYKIVELKNPYCSYQIHSYEGIGHVGGSLENEEQLNEIKERCKMDSSIQYLIISRFVNNTIETEVIVDNGPKTDGAGFTEQDR